MKGVLFDEKHSYFDFGLVLNSKDISLPTPKTYIIDIPYADGSLDLSTALTDGTVKYQNRKIKLDFTVLKPWNQLESLRSIIANHLHGKVMKVILDAECDFFYTGRCVISKFNTNTIPATLTIEVDAEPYKFNIEETVISKTVSGEKTIFIDEQKMKVVPTITVSNDMSVTFKGEVYQLPVGENIIPAIMLSSAEDNELLFTGNGNVTIKFRGGEL